MSEQRRPSFEFGPFSLDAGKRLLLRNGEPVPLAPKVLETLLALVENRERVLTKDELLTQIWGDTVVEEGGLTRNVSILRKTLGEKPDEHQFIVTVPARGYQFVAEVRETGGTAAGLPELSEAKTALTAALTWRALVPFQVLTAESQGFDRDIISLCVETRTFPPPGKRLGEPPPDNLLPRIVEQDNGSAFALCDAVAD